MNSVVYADIPRVDDAILGRFGRTSVATLHEAFDRRGLVDTAIKPLKPEWRIVGRAITALCRPNDNLALHCAVRTVKPGDVLVVAMEGWRQYALWGELIARAARASGVVGAVVDGPVRDAGDLHDLDLLTWCRGSSAAGSGKSRVGGVNVPIAFGGLTVSPGDIVVGDGDGLIVIPIDEAEAVLARAEARDAFEVQARQRIAAGEQLFELLDLASTVEQAGIDFRDGTYRDR